MFFNMPSNKSGLGASIIEAMKARENALKTPEDAARYLKDQNDSSWVSDEEADTVIKSLIKFSASKSDAKRFFSEWIKIDKGPIKLRSSTWTQSFKQKLDNIAFLGDKVSKLALEDANKPVTATAPPSAVGPVAPSYVSEQTSSEQSYGGSSPQQQIPVSVNTQETESKKMYTNTSVNVRETPDVNGKKITTLPSISIVSVSNKNTGGEWTRIIYKGSPAYLLTKYLTEAKKPSTSKTSTGKPVSVPGTEMKDPSVDQSQEGLSTSQKVLIGLGVIGAVGVAYFVNRSSK